MSEIPYFFRAIPDEYLTDAFIEDIIMMKLVRYIMRRVQYVEHEVILSNNRTKKKVKLKPYEFIFGRDAAAKECGTTHDIIRARITQQLHLGYVRSCPSSSTSTYTVYAIVPEAFKKNKPQQIPQQLPQQLPQQFPHKLDSKIKRYETTTTTPPSNVVVVVSSKEIENAAQSCKAWLDNQAITTRKRKVPGGYEEITWGNDWILPLKLFQTLIAKWGYEHFLDQMNYMVRVQTKYDQAKSKKSIDNPEAYLRKACQENYASTTSKEK